MIKLEDLLLTVYCDVAIMDNIYPMITINYKYDTWKRATLEWDLSDKKLWHNGKENETI